MRLPARPAALAIVFFAGGSIARAQCDAVATDLVAGYKATGPIRVGVAQPTGAAWQFRRNSVNGPLLEAIDSPSWSAPAWGSPNLAFLVPCAGPVYSNNPGENENNFYDRPPSFAGIMMHPMEASDSVAIFTAQTAITVESFLCTAEVLGDLSNGATFAVSTIISGNTAQRIAPTLVLWSSLASTQASASGLPWHLLPGDKIVINTGTNGIATEDWISVRADMSISGGPTLLGPPKSTGTCYGGTVHLHAPAVGSNLQYLWQIFNTATDTWTNLGNGPNGIGTISGAQTDTLTIADATVFSETSYRVVVSNACGTVTSAPAQVRFCAADLTCDGFVDDADFSLFVGAYNTLVCDDPGMPAGCPADLNYDGFVDDADFSLFVSAYNTLLCPQ